MPNQLTVVSLHIYIAFNSFYSGFHVEHFSHFFEFFAGLSLAYAGSDKFRRKVFELLSSFLASDELAPALKLVSDKTETLTDLIGEGWSNNFIHKSEEILKEFIEASERLKAEDEQFLTDNSSTQSLFLIGALFCFNILILSGFEQFHESSLLALQWLCVSALLMFIVVWEWPEIIYNWLRHHLGIVVISIGLLLLALGMDACPIEFPVLPFGAPFVCVFAILVPIIPFLIDYRAVSAHVQNHNKSLSEYLDRAKDQIAGLDTFAELVKAFHPNAVVADDEKDV
jgi:hypothetical protein